MKTIFWVLSILATSLFFSALGISAEYVYCKGTSPSGSAFSDPGFTAPAPADLQYICALPVDAAANPRCPTAIKSACVVGIVGGDPTVPGRHNVPSGAWFEAISTSGSGTPVKCHCGCFAPDTLIWTDSGEYSVLDLLYFSRNISVKPMVRSNLDQLGLFAASGGIKANRFTVGPETKPLVVLTASNGKLLRLTDTHPVLVMRNNQQVFLRADALVLHDILFDRAGNEVTVASLSTAMLPKNQNVINFDTGMRDPLAHIVVANGIQVGDHRWQQAIGDSAMRAELRKHGDLFYLSLVVKN